MRPNNLYLLRQAIQFVYNYSFRRVRIDSPPIFIVGCGHSGTEVDPEIRASG